MKYFIVAGERSGDLHGGNLVKELKTLDKEATFTGFGGDYMASAGVDVKVHYRELAFMGFLEVVLNIFKIRAFLKQCKNEIDRFQPDAVILIDYGGFNMKIAKYTKEKGIPVHYYISPKVWAWNQNRALKLKKYVDYMYVILPFEKAFFRKFDWQVNYVGNPVLDSILSHSFSENNLPQKYVALLPGSRKQELLNVLPLLTQLAIDKPKIKFVVAKVNNLDSSLYAEISKLKNVELFDGPSYDLLAKAHVAIVTSGTATLETALLEIPQVVIYNTSKISYLIAKRLIKVPFISLVNLISNKEVVRELIQSDLNINSVKNELLELMDNDSYRTNIINEYRKIKTLMDTGSASKNTAELIIKNSISNN